VSVSPTSVLMGVNSTQQFTATVKNDGANKGVSWAPSQNNAPCSPACGTVAPTSFAALALSRCPECRHSDHRYRGPAAGSNSGKNETQHRVHVCAAVTTTACFPWLPTSKSKGQVPAHKPSRNHVTPPQ
jgi:hypothetical protein